MHHFLLHLAPDPREPFFYQDCLQVDKHNIEETLKEFALCNLSLSNHQPQKTQKQHHRNITRFTQQTSKVPAIKTNKQTNKQTEKSPPP
jgi:predicted transcriptional regulator